MFLCNSITVLYFQSLALPNAQNLFRLLRKISKAAISPLYLCCACMIQIDPRSIRLHPNRQVNENDRGKVEQPTSVDIENTHEKLD